MDAITRVSYYFPTHSLTSFWILSNLVIDNQSECQLQEKQLLQALLVLFCILVFLTSFTDTYTASNNQKFAVLIVPIHGPVCFALPTEEDKDRVYEAFYLKHIDYVRGLVTLLAFLLVALFINPISMCLFPSNDSDGTSHLDAAVVRTVPILVAVICGLIMMCLGPPRQMLGLQNVVETCPPLPSAKMGDNPVYNPYPEGPRESLDEEAGFGEDASPPVKDVASKGAYSMRDASSVYGSKGMAGMFRDTAMSQRDSVYNSKSGKDMSSKRMPQRASLDIAQDGDRQ